MLFLEGAFRIRAIARDRTPAGPVSFAAERQDGVFRLGLVVASVNTPISDTLVLEFVLDPVDRELADGNLRSDAGARGRMVGDKLLQLVLATLIALQGQSGRIAGGDFSPEAREVVGVTIRLLLFLARGQFLRLPEHLACSGIVREIPQCILRRSNRFRVFFPFYEDLGRPHCLLKKLAP